MQSSVNVWAAVGLTVSIGVAASKSLAKVASDLEKPDGLVVVPAGQEQSFLAPLPAGRLWGVGPRGEERLRRLGVATIGELSRVDVRVLTKTFGRWGALLHNLANGIDERPVEPMRETKSVAREITFDKDLEARAALEETVASLAASVAERLQDRGLKGRTVCLKLRLSDFTTLTRQRTLGYPVADAVTIQAAASDLLLRELQSGRRFPPARRLGHRHGYHAAAAPADASIRGRLNERAGVKTGDEYRRSLHDGRQVWLLGEGPIDDVTTHPATAAMVEAYAAWYDRHTDPAWIDRLMTPPDAAEYGSAPLAFEIPQTGPMTCAVLALKAIHDVAFVSAGNITHTPGYGALVALGILDAVTTLNVAPERIAAAAEAFRDLIAADRSFCDVLGRHRLRPRIGFVAPADRAAVRLIKETDGGVIVGGMAGLHTSVPFADEVFIAAGMASPQIDDRVWCSVAVNAPGVRVVARKPVARHLSESSAPLSSRYDELDAQLWLDDVFVPWHRVFALRFEPFAGPRRRQTAGQHHFVARLAPA